MESEKTLSAVGLSHENNPRLIFWGLPAVIMECLDEWRFCFSLFHRFMGWLAQRSEQKLKQRPEFCIRGPTAQTFLFSYNLIGLIPS